MASSLLPLASFSDFPEDVQLNILSLLRPPDLAAFACTSRRSAALCGEPRLWSAMCDRRWGSKIKIRSQHTAGGGVPFGLLYRALDLWDALIATCAGTPPLVSIEWDPSSIPRNDTAECSSAAAEPLGLDLEWPAETRQRATKPLDDRIGQFIWFVALEILTSDVLIPMEIARRLLGNITRSYFGLGYPEDPWMPFVRRLWRFLVRRRRLGSLRFRRLENVDVGSGVIVEEANPLEAAVRAGDAVRRLEAAAGILDLKATLLALRAELEEHRAELDAFRAQISDQKRGRYESVALASASAPMAKISRLRKEGK